MEVHLLVMAEREAITNISVTWRGNQLNVDIPLNTTMEELGSKLQKLTNIMPNTLRLLIPYSGSKGSKLVYPFSEEHSKCRLNDFGTLERKPVPMMGIFSNEIEEVSDNGTRLDLRIAGFAEEDNILRQRMGEGPHVSKLPKGTYIFCDFHTLQIPGIERFRNIFTLLPSSLLEEKSCFLLPLKLSLLIKIHPFRECTSLVYACLQWQHAVAQELPSDAK